MKKKRRLLLLAFCLFVHVAIHAQINELQRSTPEVEGVASAAIGTLFDSLMALPQTDIHSVMVIRHGKVIGEIYPAPFAAQYRHTMYSCSKTFVGAAVGLAIADNHLRLTDRVCSFFPDMLPPSVSDNLADMTVRDLLTMTSGITPDWNMRSVCSDWIRTFLSKPVKTPGKVFGYDSINTYVLSAILQKVTGMTLLEYLKLKLFNPMHITDVAWEISPEGINTGGWGLYIQSESLAKFGLLLLNRGVWEDRQLLPAGWVEQMMNRRMEAGYEDYGYHLWLCEHPDAVCIDGALGQYVFIMPKEDMVVVITECSLINGRNQRRLVWEKLLPGIKATPLKSGKTYRQLQKKQSTYALPVVQGKSHSSVAAKYENKTFVLEPNKYDWANIRLQFNPSKTTLAITDRNGTSCKLPFGYKRWIKGAIEVYPPYSITPVGCFKGIEGLFWVAGSYAWQSTSALRLKVHYVNWMSALAIKLDFNGGDILLTIKENFSSDTIIIKGMYSPAIN